MLEEKLRPVLTQVRATDQRQLQYGFVKKWFLEHEENLACRIADLTYLCTLPDQERTLATYPVIGNWFLNLIRLSPPQTEHQQIIHPLLEHLIAETRFHNRHLDEFYTGQEEFNRKADELGALMLAKPNESMPLHATLQAIKNQIYSAISSDRLPENSSYKIDLSHGLLEPAMRFAGLTSPFEKIFINSKSDPLNLTIMVVDDQAADVWYRRLIAVGFQDLPGQQGYFFDGETALLALEKGSYDVILTDLQLNAGGINGVEFAKKALESQTKRGLSPVISVFSYNQEGLEQACQKQDRETARRIWIHPNTGNKINFSAMSFRDTVELELRLLRKLRGFI